MSRAQHILAVIVGLITGVLLMESYGAMVDAARAGGRAIPSCGRSAPRPWPWPWKCRSWRPSAFIIGLSCGCHGCCWSPQWPCPPCSRSPSPQQPWSATSRLVPPRCGCWQLRGAEPAVSRPGQRRSGTSGRRGQRRSGNDPAGIGAERPPAGADVALNSAFAAHAGAEVLTKRAQAERTYAELSATGGSVSARQLAAAAGLSASYARALVAEFQAQPPVALQHNGHRPATAADTDPEGTA
jgi:hypothetical protein